MPKEGWNWRILPFWVDINIKHPYFAATEFHMSCLSISSADKAAPAWSLSKSPRSGVNKQTSWWFQLFNSSEKYARQIGSFPQVGMKTKNSSNHHLAKNWFLFLIHKLDLRPAPQDAIITTRMQSYIFSRESQPNFMWFILSFLHTSHSQTHGNKKRTEHAQPQK